jgi:uncharacterized lipoprotein YmbA
VLSVSLFWGCASGPKQKSIVLDDKGAALGISTPAWVTAYTAGGVIAAEALAEYKDSYCFVIQAESTDKPFLLAWVGNVNGPMEIAAMISTAVISDAGNSLNAEEGSGVERNLKGVGDAMSNASYTGARKVSDWWYLSQNKATKTEIYQAFVLYIADKKTLNDQIVRNLQNIVDKNAEMSAAERAIYAEIMADIRRNGLSH